MEGNGTNIEGFFDESIDFVCKTVIKEYGFDWFNNRYLYDISGDYFDIANKKLIEKYNQDVDRYERLLLAGVKKEKKPKLPVLWKLRIEALDEWLTNNNFN